MILTVLGAAGLFLAILLCLEIGYRQGRRAGDADHPGLGVIDGSVFALLGLILAFSFSAAQNRLDARRDLAVDEANAIGTAYLRVRLLPEASQPQMHALFKEYIGARLVFNRNLTSGASTIQAEEETKRLQEAIWSKAVEHPVRAGESLRILLMPALNQMFDLAASRTIAAETRVPMLVLALGVSLSLLAGVLAGRSISGRPDRSWTHRIIFAAVISVTVFVIADLQDPRVGLVRIDYTDRLLTDLRDSIR